MMCGERGVSRREWQERTNRQQRYQPGLSLLIRRKAIDLLELWFDVCAVYVDEQWKILSVKQSMRTKKDMERRQTLFHLIGRIYVMWFTLEATGVGTWFVAEPWIWQQIRPWQKGRKQDTWQGFSLRNQMYCISVC